MALAKGAAEIFPYVASKKRKPCSTSGTNGQIPKGRDVERAPEVLAPFDNSGPYQIIRNRCRVTGDTKKNVVVPKPEKRRVWRLSALEVYLRKKEQEAQAKTVSP